MQSWLADVSNDPLVEWLSRAGPTGILAMVVVAFLKGWIVPGSQVDRMRAERDRAMDIVWKQAGITERAVDAGIARLELEEQLVDLRRKEAEARGSTRPSQGTEGGA